MAITAWSAKVVTRSICFWRRAEALDESDRDNSDAAPSRSRGNAEHRAETGRLPSLRSDDILRVGVNIGDVNGRCARSATRPTSVSRPGSIGFARA